MELRWDWITLIAERKIRDAMDEGRFDNVAGKGKPLDMRPYIEQSAEQRITSQILKNAQALPQWLQVEKDIEALNDEIQPTKERSLRAIQVARNTPSRQRIAGKLRKDHRERVDTVNTLILQYNMTAPQGAQRIFRPYSLQKEMAELEAAIENASRNGAE